MVTSAGEILTTEPWRAQRFTKKRKLSMYLCALRDSVVNKELTQFENLEHQTSNLGLIFPPAVLKSNRTSNTSAKDRSWQ
jgi:hypothetical protein